MSQLLVMTLLVRDEIDIVRDNIEFHLNRGVDLIVATDNGSIDGTRDILVEYEDLGVLHLWDEPEQDFSQWKWVTRMALFAREELGATWVLNNDADEFWVPISGDLKTELPEFRGDLLLCRRRNMIFGYDLELPSWPESPIYRVRQGLPLPRCSDPRVSQLTLPFFYYDPQPKALCRSRGLVGVSQGNHSADYGGDAIARTSENIQIYHFPIRSREQFHHKIDLGGASYARNQELDAAVGWHRRRWYAMIQRGESETALREALPSVGQIERDLEAGTLIEDPLMVEALGLQRDQLDRGLGHCKSSQRVPSQENSLELRAE
ncbi:MAG: glycosyltransferase family 2 protein [Thermoanaerobaculia bacterium]|nr:glycosyltransferase family 2 protein [Thermoanaerobaculia bacterium]